MSNQLTHLNERGEARMVDVSSKAETRREARAESFVFMRPETLARISSGDMPKGDVFAAARIAGVMAAKKTSDLIPLCHPVALTSVQVTLVPLPPDRVRVEALAACTGQTGVEMEALLAASVAALTIYDMCKAIDRGMIIERTRLIYKSGGKSGTYRAVSADV